MDTKKKKNKFMEHELFLDHDILAYFDFQSFETWWLLHVPPGLTLDNFIFSPHSACMCFVWTSVQRLIISLHSMNGLFSSTPQRVSVTREKWFFKHNSD